MQLSKNFYLSEFLQSQTAARMGRDIVPTEEVIDNLKHLSVTILQPIRDGLGPVYISSGYRPEWLNTAIGGARKSSHMLGRAADFTVKDYTPEEAYIEIARLGIPFDKMILEFKRWIHIQIPEAGNEPRGQLIEAVRENGKTIYRGYP